MALRPIPICLPLVASWRGLLLMTVAVTTLGPSTGFAQDAAAQGQAADQAAAGTLTLPTVDVQGTAWRSWQPVDGYVAPVPPPAPRPTRR